MSEKIEIKPPSHIATDWNFFLKQVNDKKTEIVSYFDKENWKINVVYRMRISHTYDPSHFWVVSKESEVDVLHKYLHDFYLKYKSHYKIPPKNFKLDMYCITFTEGAFYRSVLVNIPTAINKESWAFAFLIDFGFMAKVSLDEIYFMTKPMYDIPKFAIRATLSGLGPVGSSTWSSEAVTKFCELVCNKIVFSQVTGRNYAKKVLYLRLGEFNWQTKNMDSINDALVIQRVAKQMTVVDVREMKHAEKRKGSRHNKKMRLPFLSPTFDEIESGAVMDSVVATRYLQDFSCKK